MNNMKLKTLQHMIKRIYQMILVLLFAMPGVMAQTVQIHDVTEPPGEILVQVDMLDFTGVAAITLKIDYDSDLMSFGGIENTTLGGGWFANATGNRINITFTAPTGTGYTIDGKLLDLVFNYSGGFSAPLAFASGSEIADLNLQTIPATFIDGSVSQILTSNEVALVDPGLVLAGNTATVPVTIEGPDNVNSITLKIAFDPAQLAYAGKVEHAITGVVASAGDGILTITWSNLTAQNFTSLTTLLDLKFVYYGGGDADLDFIPGSEVADDLTLLPMNYTNTVVAPYFEEPALSIGTVDGTPGQSVTIPIDAAAFGAYEVGAITLKIGYDPAKLTYTGYTPFQPATGWTVSASGGELSLHRSNTGALTIIDDLLVELHFNYNGGGLAPVVFNPGTELKTIHLVTIPVEFENGMVVPDDYDATLTLGEVAGTTGFPVTIPLSAEGFDPLVEVGAITINVGFPDEDLIYTGYEASNPAFAGWVVNASSTEVTFTWQDYSGEVLGDGLLLELNFNYPGTGAAPVVFNPGVELRDTDLNLIPLGLVDGGVNIVPTAGVTVSGILNYANVAETPLDNSTVELWNDDGTVMIASTTTDVNGYYEFAGVLPGDYSLQASTTKAWGGVDQTDAFLIYGTPGAFTGIFFLAADVNESGDIDQTDAFIVYGRTQPPYDKPSSWTAPDWVFENPVFNVGGSDVSVDILGLCSGDVNADYDPIP
jgi:hypothetical protein